MSAYKTFSDTDTASKDGGISANSLLLGMRIVTCVSAMAEGYDIGVMAGVLVLVKEEFALSPILVAVLMGLFGFSAALGAIIGAPFADVCGRKSGLMATYMLLITGVAVMSLSTNFGLLVVGRSLQGMSVGAAFCVVGTYISELSPAEKRGVFVSLEPIFLNLGIFAGFGANYFLLGATGSHAADWRLMISLGAILPFLCLLALGLPCIPESPRWLYMCGRTDEAVSILHRVLSPEEAAKIEACWQQKEAEAMATWSETLCPSRKEDWMALKQGVGVAVITMASGITVIIAYADTILSKKTSHHEAFLGMLFVAGAKLVVLLIAIFLLDTVGRRIMLLLSAGLMSMALAVLASLLLADMPALVIVFSIASVIACFSLGLGGGGYVLISEVFSNRFRAKATGLAFFTSRLVNGGLLFAFPLVSAALSPGGAFFIFSALTGLGFIFMFYNVEEMKGLTLEEVAARRSTPRCDIVDQKI